MVNWAGSETVSVEDYCTFMGELIGVEPTFEYTAQAHTPLWPDVSHMHEVLGRHEGALAGRLPAHDRGPPPRNRTPPQHDATSSPKDST